MRRVYLLALAVAAIALVSFMPNLTSGHNGPAGAFASAEIAPATAGAPLYLPRVGKSADRRRAATPVPTWTATATPVPPQPAADCLGAPAYPEVRTNNTSQNQTPGQPIPASMHQPWNPGFDKYKAHINGQGCLGTTEQILEWAAKKWGFADTPSPLGGPPLHHPDLAKAMAVQETDWRAWHSGDVHGGTCDWTSGPECPYPYGDQTFGILALKRTSWPGSYPFSTMSTAFAADYAMAIIRHHYDGESWLGASVRGNIWEAVGVHYMGQPGWSDSWYVQDVKRWYAEKPWREPWFDGLYP